MKFDDTTGKKHFGWKDFKATVDRYQALDLANFVFRSIVISQTDVTVSVMAKKIATFLDDTLRAGVDLHELETTIEATFTHLNEKREKGVADFYPSTEEGRSSWECRLRFALPNEYLPLAWWLLSSWRRISRTRSLGFFKAVPRRTSLLPSTL